MPAAPGMVIKTDTPLVKKAREGVMEFLLVSRRGEANERQGGGGWARNSTTRTSATPRWKKRTNNDGNKD
jgi:hypothetical protein